MGLSAKDAANAVGITKQGIIKAAREGKISASKNSNGHWNIEPAELFRVYEPVNSAKDQLAINSSLQNTPEVDANLHLRNKELEIKLDGANKEIELLREDKENYKNRLDQEAEERRKLTLLLTDQRASKGIKRDVFGGLFK